MHEDENQKLLDEIKKNISLYHIPELHESSYKALIESTQKLLQAYHSQRRKNATLKKINADILNKIDKRTLKINAKNSQQEAMLVQQSKMAAMGEMIDAVAHQWKQPLNSISMMNDMLRDDFKNNLVDEAYIQEMTQTTHMQIEHMVNTLSEFRSFFRPAQNSKNFLVSACIDSVKILMKDELLKNNIHLDITVQKDIKIFGQINEFKHLFLNLLSNSIDAFNEKNISERKISIKSYRTDNNGIIEFKDNAQGIPPHIIADIFKPNITTKVDSKGTGIGLYMSSQIVQKHNGIIEVKNIPSGTFFRISIKF